jgi:hypothetical protein
MQWWLVYIIIQSIITSYVIQEYALPKRYAVVVSVHQIFNFQPPKNPSLILFLFFFFILACQYSFYIFVPSHTLHHIFSSAQSVVRSNRAFDPPAQIFLSSSTSTHHPPPSASLATVPLFAVSSVSDTVEPPHLLPLQKWSYPIASPSPFSSLVTDIIEVPPLLQPYKRRDESTPINHHTHPSSNLSFWSNLPIGAPSVTAVECRHVVIYGDPPSSDIIGENSDDLLLSISKLSQRRPPKP